MRYPGGTGAPISTALRPPRFLRTGSGSFRDLPAADGEVMRSVGRRTGATSTIRPPGARTDG